MTGIDSTGVAGIEERLDRITRLLTVIVTKGMLRKDAVLTLVGAGLSPKEVAGILGITGNQVSVVIYDAKQAAAKEAETPKKTKAKKA